MSMMAETYMLQAIQKGLASIRSSPDQLAGILTALNSSELAAAKAWLSDPKTNIFVAAGFPSAPNKLPFIGVTVADESQMPEQTGIGLQYYTSTDPMTGDVTNYRGSRFRGSLKATIYAQSADMVIWLSAVCKWALLSNYDWLGSDDGGGFNNIAISTGDFEPSPSFMTGVFVFARGVFLSAEYDLVFQETLDPITSTQVTGTFNAITLDGNIET